MSKDRSDDEFPKAAKGATLFSSNKKTSKSKKNRKKNDQFVPAFRKINDPHYEDKLVDLLIKSGLEVASYKKRYILRRLRVRMGRLKITSYKDYYNYISSNPGELVEIQESLSINVTRFFRNRDTFEMIKHKILPELSKNKKSIKIWSAGCAVGAEPYTLAMIATDVVPANINVSILATDVNDDLLSIARHGLYSEAYLAEMNDGEKIRYFTKTKDGNYKVKSHIKSKVKFNTHDLMKDNYPTNMDIIICRNVLIYVDRKAQNTILNQFFKSLKPRGILVLGRTETLFGDWRQSVNIISTKHRIYQKKDDFTKLKFQEKSPVTKIQPIKTNINLSQSERLNELRNFRQTYEERKKIWEKRIEQSQKDREEIRRKREIRRRSRKGENSRFSNSHSNKQSSQRSRRIEKTTNRIITSEKPSNIDNLRQKKIEEIKKTGSLTDYRKLLKHSSEPSRISKIRRDLDGK